MSRYIFTSESVSEGHPDKVCDYIADSILDAHLAADPRSRVACEVLCKSGQVVLAGEITSAGVVDYERIAREAPGEPGLTALRIVMTSDAQAVAEEFSELGGDPADWLRRMREARADPHLRAAHAAQMAMTERAITEGLAERLGTDPERDPYPGLLAATAAGVFRSSVSFWAGSDGRVPLGHLIDLAFRALADGLPERCALRHVSADMTERKDNH